MTIPRKLISRILLNNSDTYGYFTSIKKRINNNNTYIKPYELNNICINDNRHISILYSGVYNILTYSMNNNFMLSVNYNTNIILKSINTFYFNTDDILTINKENNEVDKNNNIYLIIYKI
jgi:hypothetical protein